MRKFKISDRFTTADIGLDVEGDSLAALFTVAAEGMFAIILGEHPEREATIEKEISLRAETTEQVLVDWLSELLYLFDTDGLIAVEYQIEVTAAGNECALQGKIACASYDRAVDTAEHEVKAVTYYKLEIEKGDGVYRCHVVFDL